LASQAEIGQQEVLEGQPVSLPPFRRVFVAVRNIAPGVRMRLFVRGLEGAETDLHEMVARQIFEAAASPRTREIETMMRKAAEARA
jgi:ribosomal protein S7